MYYGNIIILNCLKWKDGVLEPVKQGSGTNQGHSCDSVCFLMFFMGDVKYYISEVSAYAPMTVRVSVPGFMFIENLAVG